MKGIQRKPLHYLKILLFLLKKEAQKGKRFSIQNNENKKNSKAF